MLELQAHTGMPGCGHCRLSPGLYTLPTELYLHPPNAAILLWGTPTLRPEPLTSVSDGPTDIQVEPVASLHLNPWFLSFPPDPTPAPLSPVTFIASAQAGSMRSLPTCHPSFPVACSQPSLSFSMPVPLLRVSVTTQMQMSLKTSHSCLDAGAPHYRTSVCIFPSTLAVWCSLLGSMFTIMEETPCSISFVDVVLGLNPGPNACAMPQPPLPASLLLSVLRHGLAKLCRLARSLL